MLLFLGDWGWVSMRPPELVQRCQCLCLSVLVSVSVCLSLSVSVSVSGTAVLYMYCCSSVGACCVLKDDVISQFTFDDFLVFYQKLCGRRDVHQVFNRLYVPCCCLIHLAWGATKEMVRWLLQCFSDAVSGQCTLPTESQVCVIVSRIS